MVLDEHFGDSHVMLCVIRKNILPQQCMDSLAVTDRLLLHGAKQRKRRPVLHLWHGALDISMCVYVQYDICVLVLLLLLKSVLLNHDYLLK